MPLLEVRNLTVSFATRHGAFTAVDGVDLTVDRNEVLAIVGESGSGKSVAMLAVDGPAAAHRDGQADAHALRRRTICCAVRRASAAGSPARTWR